MLRISPWLKQQDWALIGSLVALAGISCVALLSATYGKQGSGVPTHIVAKQILFEVIGFIAMLMISHLDYRILRRWSKWIYGITAFLLVVVFGMPQRFGAHSWIPLGLFAFQPSEFAKLALIIAVSAYVAKNDDSKAPDYGIRKMLPVFGMAILPAALTLKEPALGQALVMLATVPVMYVVFAKRSHFMTMVAILFVAVIGIALVALDFPAQSTLFIQDVLVKHHLLQMFQAQRIIVWLNPNYDPTGAGYNVRLAQMASGGGGVFGEGYLKGILTSNGTIPNQWTDFIFTVIGEEFGFVGSSILILLFLVVLHRLTRIAGRSADSFGTYMVTGIVGMFAFQVFENIGMNMYLSPATGITLPFISYGGSSLVVNYIAVGLALSVLVRRQSRRNFAVE